MASAKTTAVTIYHNPRCSKSRQALALLEEKGLALSIVRYLETPPTEAELRAILVKLGMRPRALLRKGEAAHKELDLGDETLSDDALIRAMAEHPVLIERPVVVAGDLAVIGRPPERVLDIV